MTLKTYRCRKVTATEPDETPRYVAGHGEQVKRICCEVENQATQESCKLLTLDRNLTDSSKWGTASERESKVLEQNHAIVVESQCNSSMVFAKPR